MHIIDDNIREKRLGMSKSKHEIECMGKITSVYRFVSVLQFNKQCAKNQQKCLWYFVD